MGKECGQRIPIPLLSTLHVLTVLVHALKSLVYTLKSIIYELKSLVHVLNQITYIDLWLRSLLCSSRS